MKNTTKLSLALLASIIVPAQLMAATIGVAGSISAQQLSDSGTESGVDSLHLKISEAINNSTRVNVVAEVEDGFLIKEGYVTFAKPLSALGLNYDVKGLEVVAGQKLISFGIDNARYTEDRAFIGRPVAVSELLSSEGLAAKGLEVSYTLPVSLPVKLTAGYGSDLVNGDESFEFKPMSLRAAVANKSFSLGASYLTYDSGSDDNVSVVGVDGAYNFALGKGLVNLEGEVLSYTPGDSADESRTGYYLYAGYDWKNSWTTGLVYDAVTAEEDGGEDYSSFGLVVSRKLSDSAKLRFQYTSNNNKTDDSSLVAQVVFNLK